MIHTVINVPGKKKKEKKKLNCYLLHYSSCWDTICKSESLIYQNSKHILNRKTHLAVWCTRTQNDAHRLQKLNPTNTVVIFYTLPLKIENTCCNLLSGVDLDKFS